MESSENETDVDRGRKRGGRPRVVRSASYTRERKRLYNKRYRDHQNNKKRRAEGGDRNAVDEDGSTDEENGNAVDEDNADDEDTDHELSSGTDSEQDQGGLGADSIVEGNIEASDEESDLDRDGQISAEDRRSIQGPVLDVTSNDSDVTSNASDPRSDDDQDGHSDADVVEDGHVDSDVAEDGDSGDDASSDDETFDEDPRDFLRKYKVRFNGTHRATQRMLRYWIWKGIK